MGLENLVLIELSYKNTIRHYCDFNPAVKAYVNLLQSRAFRRQSSSAKHPADLPTKRANKRVRCFLCNSEERTCPVVRIQKKFSRDLDRQPEKFSRICEHLKNSLWRISSSGTFTILSFNFFSRQRQRRSMRHAFWSSCVEEDSHISSWRACLFGALDLARTCIFLPAGRRSSGSPWIVHRGSVSRKNSVNRSYINYVYVALCRRHYSAMRLSYRTLISLLAERFIFEK